MKLTPRQRGWLTLGILVAVSITLIAPFLFNADARHLSAYADGPEDASTFHSALDTIGGRVDNILATPLVLNDIEDPKNTMLVILGVERRYDPGERDAILAFLHAGGNVLLADEGGFGTDIAQEAGWAFGSERVLDTRNHLGDYSLVTADVKLANTYRVLFNKPTSLVPLSRSNEVPHEILATTSPALYPDGSYQDINGDGAIDRADRPGPFALVVRATVGEGTLILIADTGPFMNRQMTVTEFNNDAFARALISTLIQGEARVLIDESRHAPHPGFAAWDTTARTVARLTQSTIGPWVVASLFLLSFLAWRLTRPTEDWSHHEHRVGDDRPVAENVRPDAERMRRHALRRINEKYNIPMEQVQAMTAAELHAAIGDRNLADAAYSASKADAALFFKSGPRAPSSSSPEATE